MSASRLSHLVFAGAAALALAAATPALAEQKPKDNPPPKLLAKIQVATQASPGTGALTDMPAPPKPTQPAARLPSHTPEFANPRSASPSADGTRWDFKKDSTFVLGDGTKRPKGPALKAR